MNNIYTIGFTKKTAEKFFSLLTLHGVDTLIDIRLNNTSQLAGFAKYPDIEYLLENIAKIKYIQDKMFAPQESTLKKYKKKEISWDQYVDEFNYIMEKRNISNYIKKTYAGFDNICLLCSESTSEMCHRSLVANYFKSQFDGLKITNL